MLNQKRNILILMGRYLPGYKDGGPVRSIKNLVDFLGEEYNFMILTRDRDHGDTEPYPNIKVNTWNQVGNARVFYVPPRGFTCMQIKKLAEQTDMLYVCGCFNDYAINTLLLKRIGIIDKPVVIAAMGLFSPMEFRLKYLKKKLFTTVFNKTGMFNNIYWSATSKMEVAEIRQQVKNRDNFFIAQDLSREVSNQPIIKNKTPGKLRVVFISRIAPKKNLKGAIRILQQVKSEVEFTIYGSKHVPEYWGECEQELQKLPPNVKWLYGGNVESEQVIKVLEKQHVFLFPTLGENYGHVIQEALSAGCPCIISDQTSWSDLEENEVGYIIPVSEIALYANAIEKFAKMNEEEFQLIVNKSIAYAISESNYKVKSTGYRKIFDLINITSTQKV